MACIRALVKGDLNLGERHSRVTRDDGMATLCTVRAASVLSRKCYADFGRPLTKKVMSRTAPYIQGSRLQSGFLPKFDR